MTHLRTLLLALPLAACARAAVTSTPAPRETMRAVAPLEAAPVTLGLVRDSAIVAALADVSASRIRRTDSTLVSFGTRHAMSDTLSATRGVGAARRWILGELQQYARACGGCLRVEYDPGTVVVARHPQRPSVEIVNVLAWLPGRDTSRVVVMGGHYDSCVCNTDRFDAVSDAPGADDDGSGTSAVIELARVFSLRFPRGLDATVVFALYSGEELGLLGSTHFAERLHARGTRVVAGMTDDIVGNVVADDGTVDSNSVRIFAADPDQGPSRELGRYAWAAGAVYQPDFAVLPVFRLDRILRGGDHRPFVEKGDAGLRFTERLENYKRQHLPADRLADVNFGYVARVARLNAATVAALASAPASPDSVRATRDRASGGQKWLVEWRTVDGAAGYEVLWRHTNAATWERVVAVGSATSHVLDEQLDDGWAAVRSVGRNGHRSLAVSAAVGVYAAPR